MLKIKTDASAVRGRLYGNCSLQNAATFYGERPQEVKNAFQLIESCIFARRLVKLK